MEVQLEYVQIAFTRFCALDVDLHAKPVVINSISALELSRKFIKRALLVGFSPSLFFLNGMPLKQQ